MGVVLGEAAGPGQAVDDPGFFVAVYGAEFEESEWEFPVGTAPGCKNEVMHGAVHGFGVVVHGGFGHVAVGVDFPVEFHGWEHAVGVEVQVPGFFEQFPFGQVWGVDEGVACRDVAASGVFFHFEAHNAAVWVEYGESGADFVGEGEQVEFLAEPPVVAFFRFGHFVLVFCQGVWGFPGGAVDALQPRVGLVAPPVCRR